MAKYPYIVNRDGVWYPAGSEVPAGDIFASESKIAEQKSYTKTEINRMPVAELRELASESGIENYADLSGAELKKLLIKALEL